MMGYLSCYISGFFMFLHFNDWFMVWVSLEVVMYGFLVLSFDSESISVQESMYKYFFVQSLGSGALLGFMYLGSSEVVMSMLMMYKMGAGPFYFWYLSVLRGLWWGGCLLLMSLQKVIPFMVLRELDCVGGLFVIIVSLVIGLVGSIGQRDLKDLMVYSSLSYMGWVLFLMMMEGDEWMLYFLMYCVILVFVVYSFNKSGMDLVGEVCGAGGLNVILSLFMLGGVPPLLGFLLKWFGLMVLSSVDLVLVILLVFSSVLMCYVYFRMGVSMMFGGLECFMMLSERYYLWSTLMASSSGVALVWLWM